MRMLDHGRTRFILLRFAGSACIALLALHAAAAPGAGQDHHHHPPGDASRLGRVEFPTSCAPAVAARFERAVAMLHSFWFDAAEAAFDEVIAADPGCAMAHWGRAMTFMGNPMAQVSPPAALLREGAAAAARAAALSAAATPRERLWIAAVQVFFADHETLGHRERSLAAERALQRLHDEHPEDMEAAIFLSRALVANAPPTDMTFDRQLRAAAIMTPLFARHADHPGLAHYLIHAYDAPPLAEHGREAAFAYAAIAPDAPHALHMPSHIFTRLGYWDESIETNIRSARAEPDSNAAVHPMDYQVYAYLQQGRDEAARRVVERAIGNPDRFYGGLLGYNFAAMPARLALERSAWSEAASLRLPTDALPNVEAITRFARAVGAARNGAPDAAADDVTALGNLADALERRGESEWAIRVRAQQLAAEAWLARARKDDVEALRLAGAAADLEDSVEKNPVMPGPLLPARELKADLLAELGRPADALLEYERTLQREPRRGRALFGAARAAEATGDGERAAAHYRQLLEVMRDADVTRPEPAAARRFLGS
jgi:tetratricopeptide (TPR) repeat protein